ncbi:MAG: hypothetical protein ACRDK9_00445 [Solirubrobacterales bacterium]
MADEAKRIEIGFSGGQVMATRLTEKELGELRKALTSTDKLSSEQAGWHELSSEDGTVSVDLREVVFVKVAGPSHTIGFSGE